MDAMGDVGELAMQAVKEICTLRFMSSSDHQQQQQQQQGGRGDRGFEWQAVGQENFMHRRPPALDPSRPVPHTVDGPFAFDHCE